MTVDFDAMADAEEGVGCEVHEFPNSCAVQVLTEFGYTPEAFDATNQKVCKDKIATFLAERTNHVQNAGAGMSPSLQLIVLNEDQIAAGIEDLVLAAGFKKQLETYALSYRNMIGLYTKCAWESKEQAHAHRAALLKAKMEKTKMPVLATASIATPVPTPPMVPTVQNTPGAAPPTTGGGSSF